MGKHPIEKCPISHKAVIVTTRSGRVKHVSTRAQRILSGSSCHPGLTNLRWDRSGSNSLYAERKDIAQMEAGDEPQLNESTAGSRRDWTGCFIQDLLDPTDLEGFLMDPSSGQIGVVRLNQRILSLSLNRIVVCLHRAVQSLCPMEGESSEESLYDSWAIDEYSGLLEAHCIFLCDSFVHPTLSISSLGNSTLLRPNSPVRSLSVTSNDTSPSRSSALRLSISNPPRLSSHRYTESTVSGAADADVACHYSAVDQSATIHAGHFPCSVSSAFPSHVSQSSHSDPPESLVLKATHTHLTLRISPVGRILQTFPLLSDFLGSPTQLLLDETIMAVIHSADTAILAEGLSHCFKVGQSRIIVRWTGLSHSCRVSDDANGIRMPWLAEDSGDQKKPRVYHWVALDVRQSVYNNDGDSRNPLLDTPVLCDTPLDESSSFSHHPPPSISLLVFVQKLYISPEPATLFGFASSLASGVYKGALRVSQMSLEPLKQIYSSLKSSGGIDDEDSDIESDDGDEFDIYDDNNCIPDPSASKVPGPCVDECFRSHIVADNDCSSNETSVVSHFTTIRVGGSVMHTQHSS